MPTRPIRLKPNRTDQLVQMLAIFLIPTALCFAFGEVRAITPGAHVAVGDVGDFCHLRRRGDVGKEFRVILICWRSAQAAASIWKVKERFGVLVSSLFAVRDSAASCGAVIAMHDSFSPLSVAWCRCG